MIQDGQLLNYVGGEWRRSRASEYLDVRNPATGERMVHVTLSSSIRRRRLWSSAGQGNGHASFSRCRKNGGYSYC